MARIGQLFGKHNADVDRDRDGVDDRVEDRTLDNRDRTLDNRVDRDGDGVDDRVEDRTLDQRVDRDGDGIDDRIESKRLRTGDRTHRIPAVGPCRVSPTPTPTGTASPTAGRPTRRP